MEPDNDQEMDAGPELLDKLNEEWNLLSKSQPATVDFLKNSVKKKVQGDQKYSFVAFFNQKLDLNRFFIEDSEGKKGPDSKDNGMPGVEFGGQKNNQGSG